MMTKVQDIFSDYARAKPLFTNAAALTLAFEPGTIPHRERQIEELARALAPALKNSKPSNLFIYGKTGTGKSLVAGHVTNELSKAAAGMGQKVRIIYINCKMKRGADTEYRLLATLAKQLGREVPFTGLPTDQVYRAVFECIDSEKQVVLLVIDEIDALVRRTGDEILYNLTRVNSELKQAKLAIIGITNDLGFIDALDPRVRSSLGEEEFVFPPYNAIQLQDILRQRAEIAFAPGALGAGVIEKAAALAAQEHGDARRALDLLRVAAELAERKGETVVTTAHVDASQEKIDTDKVIETIRAQPRQSQAVLAAILKLAEKDRFVSTGDVWDVYNRLCAEQGLRPLTQRRVSDLIGELDMFGIITARVISKGRGGRTRDIELALSPALAEKVKSLLAEVM
ncbi:MAG: orc1/cdc6 family replication initiation protein [Candidatus Aenigmatarchaeota archaeon]